ncbi:MAG: Hsp20/alpha crystallin family protein [Halobaculum sp.]
MSRRNPIEEIEQVFERMNEELANISEGFEPEFRGDVNVDVLTRDEEVVVVADLPGFAAEEIDVSLLDRELTITAETESETAVEDEDAQYHRRERRHHSVERRVRLPEEVVEEETEAAYENGVLRVTLPTLRSDTVDSTTIEVE